MIPKRAITMLFTSTILASTSGLALAADQYPKNQQATSTSSMPGMGAMPMGQGMMDGGTMTGGGGMMGMMHSCQKMMDGALSVNTMMPRLPSGNEKLEFQMHAEMIQKIGEIATKYADRIKEAK